MHTHPSQEIVDIVQIRAQTEGISLSADALKAIAEIGSRTSLRFVMQLLMPATMIAEANRVSTVDKHHITEAATLFVDSKTSKLPSWSG